jgi:heterodisulfide reductase subunit C
MDALANIAMKQGIKPKEPAVAAFYRTGLSLVKRFGMMYEAGVAGLLTLKTGTLARDAGLGIRMLKKGKLDVLPHSQNAGEMKRIFERVAQKEKELAGS